MSTPAGWYDDGSGRQRWWDGAQWTENYAPAADSADGAVGPGAAVPAQQASNPYTGAPAYAASGYGQAAAPASAQPKLAPTLGFIGLGLAVLGTILVCIPAVVTFIIGAVVLLAALVVSLIAVFKKNTKKWPSIVGIILSIVGGIIGTIVLSVVLFVSLVNTAGQTLPTGISTPSVSEQPSDAPSDDAAADRPSPDAIGSGLESILQAGGVTDYDDMPEFYPCMGQALFDSDLSDEALQSVAASVDLEASDPEADVYEEAIISGMQACDPQ